VIVVFVKVLSVFSKYLLSCELSDDWNESLARYVVNILLDHYTQVLSVPTSVVQQINTSLTQRQLSHKAQLSRVRLLFVTFYLLKSFLANVNSRSSSLYVVVRLSVCRLSVTFVCPTQAIEIFGNVSTPSMSFW